MDSGPACLMMVLRATPSPCKTSRIMASPRCGSVTSHVNVGRTHAAASTSDLAETCILQCFVERVFNFVAATKGKICALQDDFEKVVSGMVSNGRWPDVLTRSRRTNVAK